jgi:hypothetical protein
MSNGNKNPSSIFALHHAHIITMHVVFTTLLVFVLFAGTGLAEHSHTYTSQPQEQPQDSIRQNINKPDSASNANAAKPARTKRSAAPSFTPGTQKIHDDSLGYHEGHKLLRGPRGGIYYINSNGNKTYVKRQDK